MRGGRGYYPRGSNNRRGGSNYRPSNSYGSRVNSNDRMGGRYEGSDYAGGSSSRYHSNHYDSRNRNGYGGSSSGRRDVQQKRSYPDSSRDRSNDRKHARTDDYRRSSMGHSNRTPPPPPVVSESSSYRGSNSALNSYRGGGGHSRTERSHSSTNHRHRSPPPPPKRPMRTTIGLPRPRGIMSNSNRGMRTTMRGGIRNHVARRESVDLRIMRRKLLYAQQKDRQRVLKIARLTSSLRRRQLGRHSKSPRRSRTDKDNSESEDDDEKLDEDDESKDIEHDDEEGCDENDDDDDGNKSDAGQEAEQRKKSTKAASKRSVKSTEKDGDETNKSPSKKADDGDNDEEDSEDKANTSSKSKKKEGDSTADVENGENVEGAENDSEKSAAKVAADQEPSGDKKEGKKKEKESSDKDKDKASAKKSSSKKDEKKRKDDSGNKDEKKEKKSSTTHSSSRRDEHSSGLRNPPRYIKLTCVHCHQKCVTFKEYSRHLYLPRHKMAIRQVAMRQRGYLMRFRMAQRTAQREIEEKCKLEYDSKFCHLCRLNYRQPKAKHQLSEHHKTIKKFLMPYCSTCHLAFKSPMLYETHRCSLEHIRNKARKNDSDSDKSSDELREIDLNKYTTVDSIGEIDDDLSADADIDVEGALIDSGNAIDDDDDTGERLPVGAQFIKRVDTFFCGLCNTYSPVSGSSLMSFSKKHCLLRAHLKAFLAYKEAEEAAKAKKAEEKTEEEEADEDVVVVKTEKDDNNEADDSNAADSNEKTTTKGLIEIPNSLLEDEELWKEVDKDLGELLAEVEPNRNVECEDEEEDESVLNIDIESEKSTSKDINGKMDAERVEPKKEPVTPKTSPSKPKPQRKAAAAAANKITENKEKPAVK